MQNSAKRGRHYNPLIFLAFGFAGPKLLPSFGAMHKKGLTLTFPIPTIGFVRCSNTAKEGGKKPSGNPESGTQGNSGIGRTRAASLNRR